MKRFSRRGALALSVVLLASLALSRVGTSQAQKLKVLIVTGNDVGAHNWRKTTPRVREILEKTGRFDVKVAEEPGIFESSALERYDVIVNNFGHWSTPDLSEAGKAGLLRFVKDGKGLVSLHFACSAFQSWKEYGRLIGRVWKKGVGGHGPRGKFTVKIEKAEHPITAGLKDFQADDELYAKLTGSTPIEVLASAASSWSKKVEPIVFILRYGQGRVVNDVLGHDLKAMAGEDYEALLRRSVEWAATGKVTVK